MLTRLKGIVKNVLQKKAVILMYHQVCTRVSDPWQLAVTPEHFDEQLSFLKKNFDVVPLDAIAGDVRKKNISGRKVAITFDDGFFDNYSNAKPVLESHGLPATFYIATHHLGTPQLYWWDELEQIILHTDRLPEVLELPIGNEIFHFKFHSHSGLNPDLKTQIKNWNADMKPSNERLELFLNAWMKIQPLHFAAQRTVISAIRRWAGVEYLSAVGDRVMTNDELRQMISNPLFTIGAHTVHHAMLGAQSADVQAFEVNQSKKEIEHLVSREVTAFAYPYGNYNNTTKRLLVDAGFHHAVSTENRFVTKTDDLFELPRMQVKNWNASAFSDHLTKLFSYEGNG